MPLKLTTGRIFCRCALWANLNRKTSWSFPLLKISWRISQMAVLWLLSSTFTVPKQSKYKVNISLNSSSVEVVWTSFHREGKCGWLLQLIGLGRTLLPFSFSLHENFVKIGKLWHQATLVYEAHAGKLLLLYCFHFSLQFENIYCHNLTLDLANVVATYLRLHCNK